jgi:putative Mg2+ transporter-C (MgtC) family protein
MELTYATNPTFWLQILFAIVCGAAVGAERQFRGKPIGIRTSILICLGTSAYVTLGQSFVESTDPTRVLGQVVTGVGFLGAGLIMTKDGLISGVTSAAAVWLLAAIGCGIGFKKFDLVLIVTVVAVALLAGIPGIERLVPGLRRGVHRPDTPSERE